MIGVYYENDMILLVKAYISCRVYYSILKGIATLGELSSFPQNDFLSSWTCSSVKAAWFLIKEQSSEQLVSGTHSPLLPRGVLHLDSDDGTAIMIIIIIRIVARIARRATVVSIADLRDNSLIEIENDNVRYVVVPIVVSI